MLYSSRFTTDIIGLCPTCTGNQNFCIIHYHFQRKARTGRTCAVRRSVVCIHIVKCLVKCLFSDSASRIDSCATLLYLLLTIVLTQCYQSI
jgi:hypothetical protein